MSSPQIPSRHDGVRYLYMLAAFVVIVAGMKAAEPLLNPLLLAVFVSVICAPAYFGLLRRGLSQWLALLIVAGGLCAVTVVLLAVVMDSINRFTKKQEYYQELIEIRYESLRTEKGIVATIESFLSPSKEPALTEQTSPDPELKIGVDNANEVVAPLDTNVSASSDAFDPVNSQLITTDDQSDTDENGSGSWVKMVLDQINLRTVVGLFSRLVGSLGDLLSQALLIMLTVVFILLEAGSFEGKLARAFPRRKDTTQQAEQMVRSVQRYMAIKTAASVVTAVLIGLWLRIFEVPYLPLWMLLAFLLNFIPNIGSIIAAIPAVMIAWLELGTMPAVGCAVGYIVVNVVIGNFLEPRFMGRHLGLSPLVIFCSMMFWGWVLGPIGMLLSIPLTMTVHLVLNGFDDTRWIATLMGGQARDA